MEIEEKPIEKEPSTWLTDAQIQKIVESKRKSRERFKELSSGSLEERKRRLLEIIPFSLSDKQKQIISEADEKIVESFEYGTVWLEGEIAEMRSNTKEELAFVSFLNFSHYTDKGVPFEIVAKNYRHNPPRKR